METNNTSDLGNLPSIPESTIRQLKQATRDKQTFAMLSFLLIPLAFIWLPLLIMAIKKERRLVFEIADLFEVNTNPPWYDLNNYSKLRDEVSTIVDDPELRRRPW